MKSAEATALANASRELLNKGDAIGAEKVLKPVLNQLATDASALHLMGLIKRNQNDFAEAERYFRSAIAYSFNEGGYYNDLGVILQARGEYAEALRVYRAALALVPQAEATRVNIVRCLMDSGDLTAAETEARTYVAAMPGPEAYTLLGQVQRAQDRNDEALASAEAALKFAPRMRGLILNHATALDRAGRAKNALEQYERLAREKLDTSELALNYARALYAADKKQEAEAIAEQGVKLFPGAAALHGALARMRVLRGDEAKATALLEEAIAQRPRDVALRLACADALHRVNQHQRALQFVDEALRIAPDTLTLLNAQAILLDELNRPIDALKILSRAAELSADVRGGQRNLLTPLIRAGQPEEALRIVRTLRADDPDEQYLIACEAMALRVLGDPAYQIFHDYDRLVRGYEIQAPRGFFTQENFNAALAEVLRRQHKVNAHPLDQHLHNGSQTARNLLSLDEPNIAAFRASVESAVRDYISKLGDGEDPVTARKRDRYRFMSMWSVRLGDGGYQPNHVHDRGWISSAYYVSVLPNTPPRDPRAGHIKFGEPNRPIANCLPERYLEPKPGMLLLFPSYMWHGTVPFEGSERLSASFDVAPV